MSKTFKTTLITGGAQGIGLAIASLFAEKGHNVVILDVDEEAGQEALERLSSYQSVYFKSCDISKAEQVKSSIQFAIQKTGRIDHLINNAGVSNFYSFEEITEEQFDYVLDVNLKGAFWMSKTVRPYLEEQTGATIVNIASTRALMSEPNAEAYAASKGGLLSLTHAMAISLGPNIRVNAISPGWIEVGDWKKNSTQKLPNHSNEDKAQHPVGRVGVPLDVAQAAWFLCSEASSFMTGQNLVLDGGMTIKMIYE